MTIRALVADDEAPARRRLVRLLTERDDVEIVAECSGGRSAVERARELEPDLLLLDVQMPDLDGFEVVEQLAGDPLPAVVFVTAYDQYALRAFESCAVDYVLKPFTPERLHRAVDRALRWTRSESSGDDEARLRKLLREVLGGERAAPTGDEDHQRVDAPAGALDRFVVKRSGKLEFVRAADVDWIESDGNYLRLHVGQQSHLVRGTIASCAERLDPARFARVHRRYIVSLDQVKEIQPWFGGDYMVVLRTGHKLRMSRTFRERFMSRMFGD
jgi:two-component system LytT family response regulator